MCLSALPSLLSLHTLSLSLCATTHAPAEHKENPSVSSATLSDSLLPLTDPTGPERPGIPPFLLSKDPSFDSGCFEAEWVVATPQPPAPREAGPPMSPRTWQRIQPQMMRKDETMAACTWAYQQTCPTWSPGSPNPHRKTNSCYCGGDPGS